MILEIKSNCHVTFFDNTKIALFVLITETSYFHFLIADKILVILLFILKLKQINFYFLDFEKYN